ncbi:MAG TPA: selenide, water dikinase SelD [Luteolibacter sp.]|nr:selenide, water dikinase SelD [Luteolibacter sp.]
MTTPIQLTRFSSGAGCGCKISPQVLDRILATAGEAAKSPQLLVGNDHRDDAAAYMLDDGENVLLATTDFFMPIVDDPDQFGRIAAANAISDIYAMGGRPLLALAVLGWPLEKLPAEVAGEVLGGARAVCAEAGIALAGGHSIDSEEPIFGLAVNGLVARSRLKTNAGARPGDLLFLSKPLGVGLLATAEKRGTLRDRDRGLAAASMMRLNKIGAHLAEIEGVHALTDVTGFGLLGHLREMCAASAVNARVDFPAVPLIGDLAHYIAAGAIPGGTRRNWASYGDFIDCPDETRRTILCDPQTSGGLLAAVDPSHADDVAALFEAHGLGGFARPIGEITAMREGAPLVRVA